jgi:hypothetical protein
MGMGSNVSCVEVKEIIATHGKMQDLSEDQRLEEICSYDSTWKYKNLKLQKNLLSNYLQTDKHTSPFSFFGSSR